MSFKSALMKKCLTLCIMCCPILLWNMFFLFHMEYSFSNEVFNSVSVVCTTALVISVLCGNSIVGMEYEEDSGDIKVYLNPLKKNRIIKNIIRGAILLMGGAFFYTLPLYIYGIIQVIYMKYNVHHFTMMDHLFHTLENRFHNIEVSKT